MVGLVTLDPETLPRKFSISDDTATTMGYVAETADSTSTNEDPTLRSVTITGTDTLIASVRYSKQLGMDAWDFPTFLSRNAASRVARAVEHALTTGKAQDGTTVLPNQTTGGLLSFVQTGVTTATLAAGVGEEDLLNLYTSVDGAYQETGVWMLSPSARKVLLGIKDGFGRPLLTFDSQDGLARLFGRPVYLNNSMPQVTSGGSFVASAPFALFGDFSRAYAMIGGETRIQVLTERFATTYENLALIHVRLGGVGLLPNAVSKLVLAAS